MFRFILSTTLLLGLTLPVSAQDQSRTISGSLIYLPKIALPAEAEVRITVEGAFGVILGEVRFDSVGAQVPLPFAFEVIPGLSGRLGALVRVEGKPLWLAKDVQIPAGAEAKDLGVVRMERATPLDFATAFDCGGGTGASFGILGDKASLRVGERDFDMEAVIAASGARFVAIGDESTEFWSKGDRAMLTVEGQDMGECVEVTSDVTAYRARGNEPGWSVLLADDTVELTADYGALTRNAPRPDVQVQPGAYVFDLPDISARLTLEDRLCEDDATGMPHPHHATLTLEGRTLTGCGGDPASLLTGVTWQIEDVGGKGIIGSSEITMNFAPNGRVSGGSGCNRFLGGFDLTGEELSFGQMAGTMMACPEALMIQERAVLDALGAVRRFGFDDTGALLLIGGPEDAPLLTARRG